jgi:hypothetical protein
VTSPQKGKNWTISQTTTNIINIAKMVEAPGNSFNKFLHTDAPELRKTSITCLLSKISTFSFF